ncbi:hypothetical protein Cfor_11046, partial [Coptotermes formosanus]
RGSDELLSQSGAVSNGSVMSPQPNHSDNNNEAKKVKLDKNQNGKPSKVIHIRNIPNEVTEAEIIHLGIPFGRVTNVLVLKGKNQAFLEMADEVAASTMVTYFTSCMAQLRGRAVPAVPVAVSNNDANFDTECSVHYKRGTNCKRSYIEGPYKFSDRNGTILSFLSAYLPVKSGLTMDFSPNLSAAHDVSPPLVAAIQQTSSSFRQNRLMVSFPR